MNIKSLLLGSAAALVAVSGARAADAVVVAEPEPQEYVRICDVYGTGFFYIPGTETCLRISGYARYDIGVGDLDRYYSTDRDRFENGEIDNGDNDSYYKRARFQLRVDARSETELGTLRGYLAANFQSTANSSDSLQQGVFLDSAFIELGGFMAGKRDSTFVTFNGYAGNIISDDLGVPYGPYDTNQVSYTYTGGNGFSAVIALETQNDSYGNFGGNEDDTVNGDSARTIVVSGGSGYNNLEAGGHIIDDYVPGVVAGVMFTQGWGAVSLVGGYDAYLEEGAIKGRLDFNVNEQFSAFIMAGWSSNNPEYRYLVRDADSETGFGLSERVGGLGNVNANNYYAQWNGSWGVWGGATYKFNDKVSASFQVSYDEAENFAAVLDVPYVLVPGLKITPEIAYVDNFDSGYDDWNDGDGVDGIGGFLRFERSF